MSGLYGRLAAGNLKKNRRLYVPFLLTGVCMVAVFYILGFIARSPRLSDIAGGTTLRTILLLGVWVIALFSALLLFYTSSFIVKQRRREFGLYNILGMAKRHVARVMLCENLMVAGICIGGGLLAGIVFAKLAELGLLRIIGAETTFDFKLDGVHLLYTVLLYFAVYMLILLKSLVTVGRSSPVELMRSASAGEKEPRANFLLALLGLAFLGAGYWLALGVRDAASAVMFFFVAVLLVILGTYCCFISGSVAFLKLLRRNKKFYYRADHFISTSSMIYRMRRNGAGLATICILSTMVLVMLSSVTCLLVGKEDAVRTRYTRDMTVTVNIPAYAGTEAETVQSVLGAVLAREKAVPANIRGYHSISVYAQAQGDALQVTGDGSAGALELFLVPAADYNACTGANLTPAPGTAYVCSPPAGWSAEKLTVGGASLALLPVENEALLSGESVASLMTDVNVLVPDVSDLCAVQDATRGADGSLHLIQYRFGFDLPELDEQAQDALAAEITAALRGTELSCRIESAAVDRSDFYATFSGLFFLGLVLGVAFVLAAVLIMYYKQVTEGYEDQARFGIMMRVGMTRQEIRKSVNSQILTVFFLPLVMAGVHMAFAFPMVQKLLTAFALDNVRLFLLVTLIAYAVFAVLYTAVYLMTSRAYYGIVSGAGPAGGRAALRG